MSIKTNTKPSLTLDGFKGIDQRVEHTDGQVAADIVNFRIRSDGSLEKRPGYRCLVDLDDPIRALYTLTLEGKEVAYLLALNTVYLVDLLTGERRILGTVTTTEGPACFFFYKSALYLMDEKDVYLYEGGSLIPAAGYIPLIGKDWENNYVGAPYEPKNILTRRARISYAVSTTTPSIFLCTGEPVESVEAVWRNGKLLDPSEYYIDEEFETINVIGNDKGDHVEIYMTMKNGSDELRNLLLSATRSLVFGGIENYRLFFWGCSDPSLIFCTSYVSKEQARASALHGGSANELYIPAGYEFRVGAAGHRINGCACHYDRLLIFTENDTWMASSDVSGFSELSLKLVNRDEGCVSPFGVVSVGNNPVTIGKNALYRWHQQTDFPDQCNAVRVSEEVDELITRDNYRRSGLYYDKYRNELWVFNRVFSQVWICNLTNRNWYRYDNVVASQVFDAGGRVGFLWDSALYVFDEELSTDQPFSDANRVIQAKYVSALTDFGSADLKNLGSLTLRGDGGGGTVTFSFTEDEKRTGSYQLFEAEDPSHHVIRKRLSSGRFRYGRLTLENRDGGRPVIHGLTLQAR